MRHSTNNSGPAVHREQKWNSNAQLLQCHGISINKVTKRALHHSKTEEVINVLMKHAIDIKKAVHGHPELLSIAPNVLDARLEVLRNSGIDVVEVAARRPRLLSLLSMTVESKMILLSSFGHDAKKLVRRNPAVLTYSKAAILDCVKILNDNRLDAARIIRGEPTVIGMRSLLPAIEFITKDMGRSLEEINRCPRSLTTSLEKRLKPRHRDMMMFAKRKDYSLSTLCASTEQRFEQILARPSKRNGKTLESSIL